MYQPIQMTHVSSKEKERKRATSLNEFSLLSERVNHEDYRDEIMTEAVFVKGRETLQPIEDQFQVIKEILNSEIKSQGQKFNPTSFVKNLAWKELENRMVKIFGFRNIDIMHWNEGYLGKGEFESMEFNCATIANWRYPIDGLVTDRGIYDSTRSINTFISYSLGAIKHLTAGEITAIFLHELGHNIDPALVDISYTKTNVLSKYLTEREGSLTEVEKKVAGEKKLFQLAIEGAIACGIAGASLIALFIAWLRKRFQARDPEVAIEKIRTVIQSADNSKFNRQQNAEAFADNIARMYGYGPELISGFQKSNRHLQKRISRIEKERERQELVVKIFMRSLSNESEHKTDVHRAWALIKEYEADLANPKLPAPVKKQIETDMNDVKLILNKFVNSNDEFTNRVNQMILDELQKGDTNLLNDTTAVIQPEVQAEAAALEITWFNDLFEEKKKNEKFELTTKEYKEVIERFGKTECSFARDNKGYYCYTHRCRSKSYASIKKIPQKDVNFVSSTS